MRDSWKAGTVAILALMVVTYAAVGAILGYVFTYLFSGGSGWLTGMGLFLAVALVIALWCCLRPVDATLRGEAYTRCSPDVQPRLYRIVEGLADRAGTPMPRVYVYDAAFPNAYALGRSPDDAFVCATSGLMEMLDDDQLEGVMAHELSHIMHRDTIVNGIACNSAKALSVSAIVMGAIAALGTALLGAGSGSKGGGGGMLFLILFVILIPVVLACAVMCLMLPAAGAVMRFGVSRSREYGADESASRLTGRPRALAEALLILEGACSSRDNPYNDSASASLWIVNPFGRFRGRFMNRLLDTHPSTQDRVRRLLALDAELNGGSANLLGDPTD